ncbi:MAG: SPOR domain-containing protein, partial [Hyphomicrobium sp.]
MWHSTSITRANTLAIIGISVAAISAVIACADSASAANSKSKPGAPAAPVSEADQQKQAAAASRQSYESGIKSYSGGKFQPAIDQLSGALRGGGLGSPEMAKALYVRGLAYKKLSKPGLAISDLTSALWLKNGLGEADQKAAIAERAEAYRMAGLGDGS